MKLLIVITSAALSIIILGCSGQSPPVTLNINTPSQISASVGGTGSGDQGGTPIGGGQGPGTVGGNGSGNTPSPPDPNQGLPPVPSNPGTSNSGGSPDPGLRFHGIDPAALKGSNPNPPNSLLLSPRSAGEIGRGMQQKKKSNQYVPRQPLNLNP